MRLIPIGEFRARGAEAEVAHCATNDEVIWFGPNGITPLPFLCLGESYFDDYDPGRPKLDRKPGMGVNVYIVSYRLGNQISSLYPASIALLLCTHTIPGKTRLPFLIALHV